MASRFCRCGAVLADVGARVTCPACGSPATCWLVRDEDGRLAGAASMKETLLVPAFAGELRAGLGGLLVATS